MAAIASQKDPATVTRSVEPSVQQFVPIISAAWLVACASNERFDLRGIQPEGRTGAANDVFFHHHRAEIVRSISERDLADVRTLGDP